jgi:hypothetical protein
MYLFTTDLSIQRAAGGVRGAGPPAAGPPPQHVPRGWLLHVRDRQARQSSTSDKLWA